MVVFLAVFISLLLLTIIILQCRLTIGFSLKLEGSVFSAFVTIYLFSRFSVRKIMIFPRDKKNKNDKAKRVKQKRDLDQLKLSFKVLLKLFKRSLIVKDFKLHVKEGTGNAGQTAILYGILWNISSLIPVVIFDEGRVKNTDIKIEASFNEKKFNIDFNCIFSLKIVNIILMCKEFLVWYLKNKKGGDNDVRSSNRGSNDYSNAEY